MPWNSPKPVAPTLARLRRSTPLVWVHCERCQHHAPAALVPFMIRWGAEASTDLLRRSARCSRCGGKGATVQLPGWGGLREPVKPWPAGYGAQLGNVADGARAWRPAGSHLAEA